MRVKSNRRSLKAYLLKESLDGLWTYSYEGAARAISTIGLIGYAGNA